MSKNKKNQKNQISILPGHVSAVWPGPPPMKPSIRTFDTGATRDTDEGKLDFEGFLSPIALERFAEYMHKHRRQSDGSLRDSDNWQKGIPVPQYMKSLWRHFFAVWKGYRSGRISEDDLCAMLFNAMGMLHEIMKQAKNERSEV
jgi:hypothetical protein